MRLFAHLIALSLFSALPSALAEMSDGLDWLPADQAKSLWQNYCVENSVGSPRPNYQSTALDLDGDTVSQAYATITSKFEKVASNSFYLYGNVVRAYGLKADVIPPGVNKNAHNFLSYLCGEFRDRPQMIAAKVNWVKKMNKLPVAPQQAVPLRDAAGKVTNIWHYMTAYAYRPFLNMSQSLWMARKMEAGQVTMGQYTEDRYVLGMSVCALRVIFNEYIVPNRTLYTPGYDFSAFKSLLAQYEARTDLCAPGEKDDYYDFRGDSNFKPNTPEGNGMIWYANSLLAHCQDTKTASPKAGANANPDLIPTDADCADYFQNPFRRRWQAARAGLATWMLHAQTGSDGTDYDSLFANDYGATIVLPYRVNASSKKRPFYYQFQQGEHPRSEWLPGYQSSEYERGDFGFRNASIANLNGTPALANMDLTFERLRDSVNRHTNWYQSKWDDGLDTQNSFKDQAYSPFVASSYEPSESDQFTYCGVTVPCPPDGFKHWMYVFRVKGQNKYNTDKIALGLPFNFSTDWFDETSLGTTGLANKEHAWDRLGTAMEDELSGGAVLYLHNISSGDAVTGDNL